MWSDERANFALAREKDVIYGGMVNTEGPLVGEVIRARTQGSLPVVRVACVHWFMCAFLPRHPVDSPLKGKLTLLWELRQAFVVCALQRNH